MAYPSGGTRLLTGAQPVNLVPRTGGHSAVNAQFSQLTGAHPTSNVGFTMFIERDGSISVHWLSRSVNGPNPSFPGVLVPQSYRPQIMQTIQQATGRPVRSRL